MSTRSIPEIGGTRAHPPRAGNNELAGLWAPSSDKMRPQHKILLAGMLTVALAFGIAIPLGFWRG
jgi:hypothetical protein